MAKKASQVVERDVTQEEGKAAAAKPAPRKKGRPPQKHAGQEFQVDVDTSFQEVVEADRTGMALVFDPDFFPTFTQEEREALSAESLMVYEAVERAVGRRSSRELDEEEILARISTESVHDYAQRRLEVQDRDAAYDYYWVYPDDVQNKRNNYFMEVVSSTGEKTHSNPTGKGMHIIGKKGARELILMRRRKVVTGALNKKRVERWEKAAGLITEEYKEDGARKGVSVFTADDDIARRNTFTDASVGRVREG